MCHGDTRLIPLEAQEAEFPVRFESMKLRTDSGGAGEFRGGLGISKTYRILAPCELTISVDRTQCPPWGINGGLNGKGGQAFLERADGSKIGILKEVTQLSEGDRVIVETGGGGGFGPPTKRSPARIKQDVIRGYISREAATSDYGIEFDEAMNVIRRAQAK